MVLNMYRIMLKRVELLKLVTTYRNLYDIFSRDFLVSSHSKDFLPVCIVSVYNFRVSVAVDFNFTLNPTSKT